jgi:hypothetical protein
MDHPALRVERDPGPASARVGSVTTSAPPGFLALPCTGDLGATWPALAGRAVSFAVLGPPPGKVVVGVHPDLECVFWALPGGEVVVVARALLSSVLAVIAPGQLRRAAVTLGEARYQTTALADPTRLLAHASGAELGGLLYRDVLQGCEARVLCGDHFGLGPGTGLVHAELGPGP